jgi:hypothetical protein
VRKGFRIASKYQAACQALLELRPAADIVQDAEVNDPDLAHVPALAALVPENLLPVLDQLFDAIPGELGELMEIARDFAGE